MWQGKSRQGKFFSEGLSLTTHKSWPEAGKWPLNSWKSLQAAAQMLGQEYAGGWSTSFPNICASHLKASFHLNIRVHPMEPLWSRAEQRCQICFVCYRWFKARGFFYFSMCKQSAPKPLSRWPHFCLASISRAMWRFFPYWRYSHTCVCLYCFSEAYPHSVANTAFHHKNVLSMRKEPWPGWDYPRLEAGGFWLMFLVAAFCDPTVWSRVCHGTESMHIITHLVPLSQLPFGKKPALIYPSIIALFNETWPLSCSSFLIAPTEDRLALE